jgi:5-methylcytosine-specific restriction endonuclease McrA
MSKDNVSEQEARDFDHALLLQSERIDHDLTCSPMEEDALTPHTKDDAVLAARAQVLSNRIYRYVLTRDEKYLNIRGFTPNQKREAYERQKGICVKCGNHFELDEMEADHATPWRDGGKTSAENCQMLCKDDNRRKAGK